MGYLLAGILIGPATPGFVADLDLSQQLAEIGVILYAERDTRVFMGEKELAASMTRHLLDRMATVEERVQGRTTLRQAD